MSRGPCHHQRAEHGSDAPEKIQQAYGAGTRACLGTSLRTRLRSFVRRRTRPRPYFCNQQIVRRDNQPQTQAICRDCSHAQRGRSEKKSGHSASHQQQSPEKRGTESPACQKKPRELDARKRCQELHQKQIARLSVIQRPARNQDGQHRAEQRLENARGQKGNLAGED